MNGPGGKTEYGHTLYKSGNLVWCGTCGAFAETRANRLQKYCVPPPEQYGSGGVRSQLNRLRAGLHPVTRCRLPLTTWADGSAVAGTRGYLRKTGGTEMVDDKFVPYVAEEVRVVEQVPSAGKSSKDKWRLMRGRVLLKMASAARAAKIERRNEESRKAADLVESFIRAVEEENELVDEQAVDDFKSLDESDAEFWNGLASTANDKLSGIPNEPVQFSRKPNKPSRVSRLAAGRSSVEGFCCGSMACRCSRPAMH